MLVALPLSVSAQGQQETVDIPAQAVGQVQKACVFYAMRNALPPMTRKECVTEWVRAAVESLNAAEGQDTGRGDSRGAWPPARP